MDGRLMVALAGDAALAESDYETLAHPAVGGVILFSRNYADSRALRQLTAAIRRAAGRPLAIAADHEGGRVQRFRTDGFTAVPAMRRLAAAEDAPALLRAAGIVLAAELLAHGVDMTFAPVLDLDYGASAVIGDRSFSADGEAAAALALHFSAGLAAAGMAPCGKHFPGHGFVAADSHTDLPVDSRSRAELQNDLLPFARFLAHGCGLVMTAHIVYSAVDAQAATFSARWLQDILRGELAYGGLVVSDDLCMEGAAVVGGIAARLQAAAAAGCNLLLLCQPQNNAAALAAMTQVDGKYAAGWPQLLRSDTQRVTVGDAAYEEALLLLAAFSEKANSA